MERPLPWVSEAQEAWAEAITASRRLNVEGDHAQCQGMRRGEHLHASLALGGEHTRQWVNYIANQIEAVVLHGSSPEMARRIPYQLGNETWSGTRTAEPIITLREVWGPKSWLVNYGGQYWNDRPPHVALRRSRSVPWPAYANSGQPLLREPRTERVVLSGERYWTLL